MPAGWLHCVLNVEAGVALTGNFVPSAEGKLEGVLKVLGSGGGGDVSGFPEWMRRGGEGETVGETDPKGVCGEGKEEGEERNDGSFIFNTFVQRLREKRPDVSERVDKAVQEIERRKQSEKDACGGTGAGRKRKRGWWDKVRSGDWSESAGADGADADDDLGEDGACSGRGSSCKRDGKESKFAEGGFAFGFGFDGSEEEYP